MDKLPELPFEQVLSYLNMHDRLMLSAVSRSCHEKIANSRVKFLCYSERQSGWKATRGKGRWVSGAFAEHFIRSSRFESFFGAYSRSVLSELKHLRLYDISLDLENQTAFSSTLELFSQLEELDIIGASCSAKRTFKLTLPTLTSIHLEELNGIKKLTLNAPRLKRAKFVDPPCNSIVEFVHSESVERFITNSFDHVTLRNLKNLKYLHHGGLLWFDTSFLTSLKQLKEIHLNHLNHNNRFILDLFEQKRQLGRADLKIYLGGLLLNGPDDRAGNGLLYALSKPDIFNFLAEDSSRLADEIAFCRNLYYSEIGHVAPSLEADILRRFTDLCEIHVLIPVPSVHVQRFLELLKNFQNIVELRFSYQNQPQDLFDRLPEYCTVQKLFMSKVPSDLRFLFRLKHLIHLDVDWTVDIEFVRNAFQQLPNLAWFNFKTADRSFYLIKCFRYYNKATIEIVHGQVKGSLNSRTTTVLNLNAAIEFIFPERKRDRLSVRLENPSSKRPAV